MKKNVTKTTDRRPTAAIGNIRGAKERHTSSNEWPNFGEAYNDASAAYTTLLRDGHIEQVTLPANFPAFQVGSLTGQGRVFHEQGGYRDERTYLDRQLDRAKNKPVLVWGYLILSALAILATILSVAGIFKPC